MNFDISQVTKLSYRNEDVLIDDCVCYYCLKTFKKAKIQKWVDQGETALCPFCSIDAVIPDIFEEDFVKQAQERFF